MSTKPCTACGETKPLDQFHRHKPSKDGRKPSCKSCQNAAESARRLEPDHRAVQAWHDLNKRVRMQSEYSHVKVLITREQFLAWAVPEFTKWMTDNPGNTGSVDRIEAAGHYEIANLRIISRGLNSRLNRANHNVHAPAGQAWCGICQIYKPVTAFQKNRSQHHGLQTICKPCRSTSRQKPSTSGSAGAAR